MAFGAIDGGSNPPGAIFKMKKRGQQFKYPRLMLFILTIIVAYLLFQNPQWQEFIHSLKQFESVGVFIAGFFYAFGFTAPFSMIFFISIAKDVNILTAAIAGGLGSTLADYLIFRFTKISFRQEFIHLSKTKLLKWINKIVLKIIPKKVEKIILITFSCIVIASPLPDEFGVTLLTGLTKIKEKNFKYISFILDTIGILIIILIGRAL